MCPSGHTGPMCAPFTSSVLLKDNRREKKYFLKVGWVNRTVLRTLPIRASTPDNERGWRERRYRRKREVPSVKS